MGQIKARILESEYTVFSTVAEQHKELTIEEGMRVSMMLIL